MVLEIVEEDRGDGRNDVRGRRDFTEHRGSERPTPDREVHDRDGEHDADITEDDQHGEPDWQRVRQSEPRQCQHDERRYEEEFVGHRIEPRAEARFLTRAPGDQSVQGVGEARGDEHRQRPAQVTVHDKNHERRDEEHPQQRELIGDGQRRHLSRASAWRRPIASVASAPVTGRDG